MPAEDPGERRRRGRHRCVSRVLEEQVQAVRDGRKALDDDLAFNGRVKVTQRAAERLGAACERVWRALGIGAAEVRGLNVAVSNDMPSADMGGQTGETGGDGLDDANAHNLAPIEDCSTFDEMIGVLRAEVAREKLTKRRLLRKMASAERVLKNALVWQL